MQSKHSEAMEELKKICLTHQIFPPEPSSVSSPFAFDLHVALAVISTPPTNNGRNQGQKSAEYDYYPFYVCL